MEEKNQSIFSLAQDMIDKIEQEVETYRPLYIRGTKTRYLVSNHGRVIDKSLLGTNRNPFVTPYLSGDYLMVNLYHQVRKPYRVYLHRLVAFLFLPNPDGLPFVNHKDGNKLNNCVWNLEWTTPKGNSEHAVQMGLYLVGERHKQAFYTDDQIKRICQLLENNYGSEYKIANECRCRVSTVLSILYGKTWKHISKDFDFSNSSILKEKEERKKKREEKQKELGSTTRGET